MGLFKRGCTDKPVESVTEDCFNVQTYVNGLCSFIRTCETPMTISIQGDWGSGKTSMMNMIKENMLENIVPIWFNTWQFSQFDLGNNLVFSMLEVLMNQLGARNQALDKIRQTSIAGLKKTFAILAEAAAGGVAAEMLENALSGGAQNYADDIMKLKEQFQSAVDKKLKDTGKERVVVFVDDLDRLQPCKAVELLEVLKLFLDCENCVFVLAVDYEVVTLGIKQKFGNDVSEEKGKSFFDKIIQLPFKMPVAQYDIKNYVKETLGKMSFNNDDTVVDIYVDLIKASIGFNPRSMKRLFNTYQLLDIITKSTVTGMDDAVRQRILFAIICMQMQYEGLYTYFATSPTALENEEMSIYLRSDAAAAIMEYKEFAELITEGSIDKEDKVNAIVVFMRKFMKAIQLDNDDAISDEERNTLHSILKCSVVTSVNDTHAQQEDAVEKQYRWENRQLAKHAYEILSKEYGEFSSWLPRKERPDEGIKLSDACYYKIFDAEAGFKFSLEYYLRRVDNQTISVSILLRDKSSLKEKFLEVLGDSPLDCYSSRGNVLSWGGIDYLDVLRLNYNDDRNADLIASEWKKAYLCIKKYLR
ncbi:MAG: hypothetical protein J6A75_01010 [Lachnospiraceae bacterium]|nr:hypothetical protein [Lachnospiraceae bacterium]